MSLTYGYDNNGNITSIAPGKTYTYDALDRLDTANGSWGSLDWGYDGVGNRLTENATAYTYVTGSNKLSTVGGVSFGFDSNGNTTSEGVRVFEYNQNQRLIRVTDGGVTKGEYTYNGNGQRVKKVAGSVTTIFHYNQSGQIIAESDANGNITAEYVYLNGRPLAKIEGASTYYYHNDHLGTPQRMTDSTGAVVWSADYKPFGEATITVSTITNNLRFPGQYFDAETGLHYNYYRDYNAMLGGYVEADVVGLEYGTNHLYRYVRNNPMRLSDMYGLHPILGSCERGRCQWHSSCTDGHKHHTDAFGVVTVDDCQGNEKFSYSEDFGRGCEGKEWWCHAKCVVDTVLGEVNDVAIEISLKKAAKTTYLRWVGKVIPAYGVVEKVVDAVTINICFLNCYKKHNPR